MSLQRAGNKQNWAEIQIGYVQGFRIPPTPLSQNQSVTIKTVALGLHGKGLVVGAVGQPLWRDQ